MILLEQATTPPGVQFLFCIIQYVLIAVCLVAVGGIGVFLGTTIRKNKNKKEAALAESKSEE